MTLSPAIDRYARSRQIDLARSIQSRKKVYLDTRFWIIARNVVQGETVTQAESAWFERLRRGVADGRLICPISDSAFLEIMDQTFSASRRLATAALVDELSLGVCLTRGETRAATEIAHYLYRMKGNTDLYDMQELVWTKVSYVLGNMHPTLPELGAALEVEMQKEVFDLLWGKSLTEMVSTIGPAAPPEGEDLGLAASTIDADIKLHLGSLKSYRQTYRDEIVGAADSCCPFAMEWFELEAEKAGHGSPVKGSPEWDAAALMSRNLLAAAFAKPETKYALRYMHVQATMHAAFRWNKGAKFTSNHFFDIEHACAALSYCDAFFTEAFLANVANARHTGLTDLNGCHTTSSPEEAIQILSELGCP